MTLSTQRMRYIQVMPRSFHCVGSDDEDKDKPTTQEGVPQ